MAQAMRVAKAMKRRRRKSVIAKGKRARFCVFRGTKAKTYTGLKKTDLITNRNGKIVSKKASAQGEKAYGNIRGWAQSVRFSRKALNLKGFVAVNGKNAQGRALYAKTKDFYSTFLEDRRVSRAEILTNKPHDVWRVILSF